MQIDGHHTGTYVVARFAGFPHEEAEIIAYAAQYVDDATNEGPIMFKDSEYMYSRIASAYSMLDASNFMDAKNHLSWLPFHFLPGNCGEAAGRAVDKSDLEKLACVPDSHVARDILKSTLEGGGKSLHRLGVVMHVYADSFAHQKFVGTLCKANRAEAVTSGDMKMDERIRNCSKNSFIHELLLKVKVGLKFALRLIVLMIRENKNPLEFYRDSWLREPVGHAAVDSFPDQPTLSWQYVDWQGKTVHRDNLDIFLNAFEMMTRALRAWRAGDTTMTLENHAGLTDMEKESIKTVLLGNTDPDGAVRHLHWLDALARGHFSFGRVQLSYVDKGDKSWKFDALKSEKILDSGYEEYLYSPGFMCSDWKRFHDALQDYRADVLHNILPRYGICAG